MKKKEYMTIFINKIIILIKTRINILNILILNYIRII